MGGGASQPTPGRTVKSANNLDDLVPTSQIVKGYESADFAVVGGDRRGLASERAVHRELTEASPELASFDRAKSLVRVASIYDSRKGELPPLSGQDYTSVYEWAIDSENAEAMNAELSGEGDETWQLAVLSELRRMFRLVGSLGALSRQTSIPEQIVTTVKQVCDLLDCESATVYLMDPKTRDLRSVAGKHGHTQHIPFGCGVAGYVARSLQPLRADSPEQCPHFDSDFDAPDGMDVNSILCVPMLSNDSSNNGRSCYGVLVAMNKTERRRGMATLTSCAFSDDDELMLFTFATHARIHLNLLEVHEKQDLEGRQRQGLLSIAGSLTSVSLSTKMIVLATGRKVKALMGARRCRLCVLNSARDGFWTARPPEVGGTGSKRMGERSKTTVSATLELPPSPSGMIRGIGGGGGSGAGDAKPLSPFSSRNRSVTLPRSDRTDSARNVMLGRGSLMDNSANDDAVIEVDAHALSRSLLAAVVKTGQTINVENTEADVRYNLAEDGPGHSMIAMPVIDRNGTVLAVLQVVDKLPTMDNKNQRTVNRGSVTFDNQGSKKKDTSFSSKDTVFLRGIASIIGLALGNANRHEEAERSNQQLDTLIQAVDDYVIMLDAQGRLLRSNKSDLSPLFGDGIQMQTMRKSPHTEWMADAFLADAATKVMKMTREDSLAPHKMRVEGHIMFGVKRVVDFNIIQVKLKEEVHAKRMREASATASTSTSIESKYDEHQCGVVICISDKTAEDKMRTTLDKYVYAPSIVDQLISEDTGDAGPPASSSQLVTILFADIRGYTSQSESENGDDTLKTLNEYFELMVQDINEEGGTVDKFIGDAVMAVWGVPNCPHPDDPKKACRAALRMLKSLGTLNARRSARGDSPLDIGVGIGTGNVVCGVLGGGGRYQYTVIGDAVNLSSRIESMCPNYGVRILIDDNTRRRVKDDIYHRYIDHIRAVGKKRSTEVFEVLGVVDEESRDRTEPGGANTFFDTTKVRAALPVYERAIALYKQRDFRGAAKAFRAAQEELPDDEPTTMYSDRCDHLTREPPPADWDMIWDMERLSIWTMGTKKKDDGRRSSNASDGDGDSSRTGSVGGDSPRQSGGMLSPKSPALNRLQQDALPEKKRRNSVHIYNNENMAQKMADMSAGGGET
jgi:class 3 adenylate cyclase/GAF domain-containing protein